MATSGTTSFTVTRDDIINAALRKTTRFEAGETIPPSDIATCAFSLNMMVKEMALDGLPLWCVQQISIPLVSGQASYNLSTASNSTHPLRVLDLFLRDSSGNDTSLSLESRYEYNTLGEKSSPGSPNQAFYDPQLGAGTITLYNVPDDPTDTLIVVIQRQIQDVNISTHNPDSPQEAYLMLVWSLADLISIDYSVPRDIRVEIAAKAQFYRSKFFDSTQEQVSITFAPTIRGTR